MEDTIQSELEDEFRSCCGDEDELEEIDEFSVRMLFKGVSVLGVSGIGVMMEGPDKDHVIQVQKKLDFFIEEDVADYLALMDGLFEAIRNNIRRVYAFTNSQILFDQVSRVLLNLV